MNQAVKTESVKKSSTLGNKQFSDKAQVVEAALACTGTFKKRR